MFSRCQDVNRKCSKNLCTAQLLALPDFRRFLARSDIRDFLTDHRVPESAIDLRSKHEHDTKNRSDPWTVQHRIRVANDIPGIHSKCVGNMGDWILALVDIRIRLHSDVDHHRLVEPEDLRIGFVIISAAFG